MSDASRINHVSVSAKDLQASVDFYVDVLGAVRLATPNFGLPVQWLAIGESPLPPLPPPPAPLRHPPAAAGGGGGGSGSCPSASRPANRSATITSPSRCRSWSRSIVAPRRVVRST